jgi:DNA-binding NarL/FixJ family response regulator
MRRGRDTGTDPRLTVVVADRHDLVRRALTELIDVEPGFVVVGQAPDQDSVAAELGRRQPSLILLEPAVLGKGGLEHLPGLLRLSPLTRAVVLADETSPALARHAHGWGAVGTILKHAAPDDLFKVLRHAMQGPLTLAPEPTGGA